MRFRTRLLCAASAVAAVITLQGALLADTPAPKSQARLDARQILLNARNFYKSASSMKINGLMDTVFRQDGKVIQQKNGVKLSILFKRPNKFALTSSIGTQYYSDGKTFYSYSSAAKRYAKVKMNSNVMKEVTSSATGLSYMGLLTGMNYSSAISSYKLLDDARIDGRDVYVIALTLKPGVAVRKDAQGVQTLWIGKKDFGIYKSDFTVKMSPKAPKGYKGKVPKLVEDYITRRTTKLVANASVPDSEFRFHPPAGAKPVEMPKPPPSIVKKSAPNFSFKWTDGSTKSLSDFRGKKIVLDFWAYPFCEKHLPVLQSLYNHYKGKAQIISINLNTNNAKVQSELKSKHYSFPVIFCDAQMVKTINRYGLRGLPTVYIIDEKGMVTSGFQGNPTEAVIAAKIK